MIGKLFPYCSGRLYSFQSNAGFIEKQFDVCVIENIVRGQKDAPVVSLRQMSHDGEENDCILEPNDAMFVFVDGNLFERCQTMNCHVDKDFKRKLGQRDRRNGVMLFDLVRAGAESFAEFGVRRRRSIYIRRDDVPAQLAILVDDGIQRVQKFMNPANVLTLKFVLDDLRDVKLGLQPVGHAEYIPDFIRAVRPAAKDIGIEIDTFWDRLVCHGLAVKFGLPFILRPCSEAPAAAG
jgi:hypothetical protein